MILGLGGSSRILGKNSCKSPEAEQECDAQKWRWGGNGVLPGERGEKIRDWLAGLFQEYSGTASSWMGKNRQRILDNEAGEDGRLL